MALSMTHLLIHHESVPLAARQALRAAVTGPLAQRFAQLELAAGVLRHEMGLDCDDVRELVGFPPQNDCG